MRTSDLSAFGSLVFASGIACTRVASDVKPAPEPPASSAATASSPIGVAPGVGDPALVDDIEGHVGARVSIDVRPATLISQHMIGGVAGKNDVYVQAVASGNDFVAYVPGTFSCPGTIRLVGTVITMQGGGKGTKSTDVFHETQLDVERWTCR